MDNIRILVIVAEKWGFYYITKGIAKHSRHDYTFKSPYHLPYGEAREYDVINCLNADTWNILEQRWGGRVQHLLKEKKVICGAASKASIIRGLNILKRVPFCFIRAPSIKMAKFLESKLDNPNIRVIPLNCTDTDKFRPLGLAKTGFTVGWAGNYIRAEKRSQWLHGVKYPLRIATVNPGYLELNDHAAMNQFYNILDAYICMSRTEGAPVPMLEAMAAGLPVVSTDVGLAPELLEPEWVFPDGTRDQVVDRMNRRLDRLCEDEDLRWRTAERNRRKIVDEYSAQVVSRRWDELFEE